MALSEVPVDRSNGGSSAAGGVIRTVELTKVYAGADFRAVDGLNLSVAAGEIFGLLGPNGAGKTTTAGMLTTRVIPSSGQAFVGGIDVVAQPSLAKQILGIVSQQNTLDRQLTVWENLYFHGRLFGVGARESRRTADGLLEQFQLSDWAKASVYALSGGMAQRLMVARAIFHRPAVLFLDEPTAGLDPQGRLALWELLGELNAEGQTILLTTHYMEEAEQLCGRVAIMDHGKIIALDTPARLRQSVGVDTIVTVRTSGDHAALARVLEGAIDGVTHSRAGRRRSRALRQGCRSTGSPCRQRRGGCGLRCARPLGYRAKPRDRVHQPHGQGAARLMATADLAGDHLHVASAPTRSAFGSSRAALGALILRDLVVLRKHAGEFVVRTLVQPFLLCFVFLFVFPKIGQQIGGGRGGGAGSFATVLVPGVVGISIMFQGVQSVALQMATEFGYTREIEDRVQAPCPIWLVAISKVLSGVGPGPASRPRSSCRSPRSCTPRTCRPTSPCTGLS